jgi:hypothetical protein
LIKVGNFQNEIKETILNNLDKYVEKDERAAQMLVALRAADRKTFLLTNSGNFEIFVQFS